MNLVVRQDGPLPGQFLMDRDRDELEAAAVKSWGPCLTIYEWEVPTLSLGFHQETAKLDVERLATANVPYVRRPTGGAAVLHSDELTYAIVVPDAPDLRAGSWLQEYVGRAITEALRTIGVELRLMNAAKRFRHFLIEPRVLCGRRAGKWQCTARN